MGAMLRTLLLLVLFAGAAGAQAPVVPPAGTGTNALLGRVVEVGTDTPVAGAVVTLTGPFVLATAPREAVPLANITGGSVAAPSVNVMTTGDGYFVVRNLPSGLFTAAVRAAGYVNSDAPPTIIEVRDSPRPTEHTVRLWRFAAIGGRVTDDHGEPLTGIQVTALSRVGSGNAIGLRPVATELTDDRGEYRIARLTPGDYAVGVLSTTSTVPEDVAAALDPTPANREGASAMSRELIDSLFSRTFGCSTCLNPPNEGQHAGGFVLSRPSLTLPPGPDGRPLGFTNTYYPGTSRPAESGAIVLRSGESRSSLDFVVRLSRTVHVAGVLTGPDGPMPHVALNLVPAGSSPGDFGGIDGTGRMAAVSDTSGGFVFLGVPPGDYTLYATWVHLLAEPDTGEGRTFWMVQPLNVGDTDVDGVTVQLRSGIRISGRFEFKGGAPPIINGLAGMINAHPAGSPAFWRTQRAAVLPDGSFRSAGDPAGRYTLNAILPPAAEGWFWQSTTLDGRSLPDEMVELVSDEVTDLVLTFGRTTNRISGRVTDAAGDMDVAVIAFAVDSAAWRTGTFDSRHERKVLATTSGAFDIETMAPGDYYVAAVDARLALNWSDAQFLDRLIPAAIRVTLGPEDQRTVSLRMAQVSGRTP